jgi:hypothetical protein
MALAQIQTKQRSFGETSRPDNWWLQPLLIFLGLSSFVVYVTWAAFQGRFYYYGPYLSPFYAPEIFGDSPHAWFPGQPAFWPSWAPWSPAFLILWGPGLFRFTCYYYRGAYYKAFWADPPACAVGEPRSSYLGERFFPLILQNVHRYFFYVAVAFVVLLAYDAIKAYSFPDGIGIGLGSLIMTVNVVMLSGYTFGCHSMRHISGGCMDSFSQSPLRHKTYECVSCLNGRHMLWAWMSLFSVALTDVYIRLLAMGVIADWRIL